MNITFYLQLAAVGSPVYDRIQAVDSDGDPIFYKILPSMYSVSTPCIVVFIIKCFVTLFYGYMKLFSITILLFYITLFRLCSLQLQNNHLYFHKFSHSVQLVTKSSQWNKIDLLHVFNLLVCCEINMRVTIIATDSLYDINLLQDCQFHSRREDNHYSVIQSSLSIPRLLFCWVIFVSQISNCHLSNTIKTLD